MNADPGNGFYISGTGRGEEHTCRKPDVAKLEKADHGLIWKCLGGNPACGLYWRYNDQTVRWSRLRPWHLDWWKYDFFA